MSHIRPPLNIFITYFLVINFIGIGTTIKKLTNPVAKCNYKLNNFIEVLEDLDTLAFNNDESIPKSMSSELHFFSR
jgi:hypothetical protein